MTMVQTIARLQAFDMNILKNRWAVPTNGAEVCLVGGEPHSTWAGTATVYRSVDGVTPYAPEGAAVTLTAASMSRTIDSSGFPFIVFEVSVAGAALVNLWCQRSASA